MINQVPVPKDVLLPFPTDGVLLQALIVVLFLAHILFVNLMLGGVLMTVACEILGLRRPNFDTLAHEIARTVTVNKSLAVVLGVGPLLAINVLYTIYFYSANALTGTAWIMIVPLVATAFLVTYLHKYSWEYLARFKTLHIGIGLLSAALFLCVPFIFLANINLMLFPHRWTEVRGFLSTLLLPNVLPRFLHFLLACLAVTALFLVAYLTRRSYPVEQVFSGWDRATIRRGFYSVAFFTTAAQFVAGPLLFFTLPSAGMSWLLVAVIAIGVVLALWALLWMWREISADNQMIGRRFVGIVAMLALVVLCMGYGRHLYRETAIDPHRRLTLQKAADYRVAATAAHWRQVAGVQVEKLPLGELVYNQVCAACHMSGRVLVGPSLEEIAEIYAGNPDGIIKWTNAPGRKRMNLPPMAAQPLGDKKLRAVAEYMLRVGASLPAESDAGSQPAADPSPPADPPASAPAA